MSDATATTLYQPFAPTYDPYAFYEAAHREGPLAYSPQFNVWLVLGYDALLTVLKDPQRYSSADNLKPIVPWPAEVEAILTEGYPMVPVLFNNDPPSHTRIRSLFAAAFTPQRVAAMEPTIRALAHQLVDGFVADGAGDLLTRFAFPLPMTVIGDLTGVPRADHDQLKRWLSDWIALYNPALPLETQCELARSIVAVQQYYAALLQDRQANPRNDLATAMVQARVEGMEPLTMAEMVGLMVFLNFAGHETTTNLIGALLLALLPRRDLWDALATDSALVEASIEEGLRYDCPVQMEPRITTEAVTLAGQELPAGTVLYLFYGAANRDAPAAACPHHFDPTQEHPQRHLGFAWGTHFCMGATLARLEARIALEVLRERLPALRLAPDFVPSYVPNFYFRHLAGLACEW